MTLPNNIEHARRRTVNFVLGMIALVWMLSCLICLPPVFGWNDWPEDWNDETHCELSQKKGYVIYSAMGSFYIPLAIIMFVYFKIFQVCKISLKFYPIFPIGSFPQYEHIKFGFLFTKIIRPLGTT